jgi:hypothetical protein
MTVPNAAWHRLLRFSTEKLTHPVFVGTIDEMASLILFQCCRAAAD